MATSVGAPGVYGPAAADEGAVDIDGADARVAEDHARAAVAPAADDVANDQDGGIVPEVPT
jgi:hypothetical protein